MAEMFEACGQRFPVYKRAHKTCDRSKGLQGRRMPRAVHLGPLGRVSLRQRGRRRMPGEVLGLLEGGVPQESRRRARRTRNPEPSVDRFVAERDVVAGTHRRHVQDTPATQPTSVRHKCPMSRFRCAMRFAPVRGRLHIRQCASVSIAGVVSVLLVRAAGLSGCWLGNGRTLDLRHDPEARAVRRTLFESGRFRRERSGGDGHRQGLRIRRGPCAPIGSPAEGWRRRLGISTSSIEP